MLINLFKSVEINLRITSIVILFVVTTLVIINNILEVEINFHSLMSSYFNEFKSISLNVYEVDYIFEDIYIPPNYGAPDSQHGSGTR